jgi:MFS family permease
VRRGGLLPEAWAGLRFLLRHPALRGIAIAYSGYQASWGLLLVAVPVAIGPDWGGLGRDQLVGWLWSACGVAGALGALAAGPLVGPGRERAAMVGGMAVTALGAALPAGLAGIGALVGALMLVGVVAGPTDVGVLTLRQRLTPPEWLGRVLAVSISLNTLGFPVGAALGGVLSAHDPAWAFAAAGLCSAASAAAARFCLPGRA